MRDPPAVADVAPRRLPNEPGATAAAFLSPASRFLLLTTAMRADDVALRRVLTEPIDWNELYALADRERAGSVVFRHLDGLGGGPPDPMQDAFRGLATMSVMRMMRLELLLYRTLDELAERGIEAMLLKGAGLALSAYPDFEDRPMGDIDLLVRPSEAEAAWSHMRARGWSWPEEQWGLERYRHHQHLPPLIENGSGVRLEIHGNVLPGGHPFALDTDDFWTHARHVSLDGRTLTLPDARHQLWHCCVHFGWQHGMAWGGWRALRDVAAIAATGEVDWDRFGVFARETRAAACCYWVLRLARAFSAASVPERVVSSLRPPAQDFMVDLLDVHYLSSSFPSGQQCPSVWLRRRLWEAGMRPRWSGHGSTRPWHVGERWAAGAGTPEDTKQRWSLSWSKLPRLGAWLTYLRYLRKRVPLPETSLTSTGQRP